MKVQCCKCERVRSPRGWEPPDVPHGEHVTSTYCPACLHEFRRELWWARRHRTRAISRNAAYA